MLVTFFDREWRSNPLNGRPMDSASALDAVFLDTEARDPFFIELIAENEKVLLVGVGPGFGSIQHSSLDGMPPYLMAVGSQGSADESVMGFLMDGTVTPVSTRYKLSRETVEAVARCFLLTGEPSRDVTWEEI